MVQAKENEIVGMGRKKTSNETGGNDKSQVKQWLLKLSVTDCQKLHLHQQQQP